jgi:site-specific recombinase XerD
MYNNIPRESLPELVREYASYKSAIQNCSEKTVSEYMLDLRTFFRYLLSRDQKISPDSEEFEQIDISGVDLEYIKYITT